MHVYDRQIEEIEETATGRVRFTYYYLTFFTV